MNNPPPPPPHSYGSLAPPGLPGQYPSLQPSLFYPGTIPSTKIGNNTTNSVSGATGVGAGGFTPFGSLPFNAQPSFPNNKRGREEQQSIYQQQYGEDEDESEEIHSFPPPPTSKQIPNNNLRSDTAQFMPTQQQYAEQPPLPKGMSVLPPSMSSSTSANTSTNSSHNNSSATSPKPKKSKKDNQSESNSNTTSTTNNTNTNNQNSSSSSNNNNQINNTLPPVLNLYQPFTSAANALFGNDAMYDESIRKLMQFIFSLSESDNIELEGKIGYLIMKDRKQRLAPQLMSGEIIHRPKECEFQSRIRPEIFKHVNNLLNERYSLLQDLKKNKQYNGPTLTYGRCNETDKFYEYYLPPSEDDVRNEEGELDHRDIRVTFDTETNKPIRAMIKSRLEDGDIDFSCPHRVHDFRISFRREKKIDKFPDMRVDKPKKIRRKSRISYTFGICRIDLTSVESFNCHKNGEIIESTKLPTFEIEVECDTKIVMQSKSRLFDFVNYLREFLDIIRMLCLICEPTPPQHHQQHQQHHQQQHYRK